MKKIILIISLLFGFNAQAGLISIELSDDHVGVGESITVNLIASDFSPFDTFDFDFEYNTSLFSYEMDSLTSDLSLALPLFFGATENGNGLAISFVDFFPYLNTDFVLASFEITATSVGSSEFSLGNVLFSDFFTPIDVDSSAQASASIPEPSTWILFLGALMLFGRIKRSV
ncbi:MAG: cohesin domain-containing protein [Colwellia sp.]|nr:cohesin domain-containing protein [Colwellia sp.]